MNNQKRNIDLNNINNEFVYIPGYLPIPLTYLYQHFKYGANHNKEIYQESNSVSQLSTTSDGDYNIINNNNNSNLVNNKTSKKEKNFKNLEESIKKGIEDISNIFNSSQFEPCPLTLACYYHCDLTLSANEEYYYNLKINDIVNNFKMKKKNSNEDNINDDIENKKDEV